MSGISWQSKVDRFIARQRFRNLLPLRSEQGVISFTFDDVAANACDTGRSILESEGCHATWYVAGGLTGLREMGQPCHRLTDLQQLAESGHEIGCHTYSHTPCELLNQGRLLDEFAKNRAFLEQHLAITPRHFAFPLGSYGIVAKRAAANTFISSRLTRPGIQVGQADLNGLLAQRLYHLELSPEALAKLITRAQQQRGWLIFYTHDVCERPSPWGTTPRQLREAIQLARASGCRILPVGAAIEYWREAAQC